MEKLSILEEDENSNTDTESQASDQMALYDFLFDWKLYD